MLDNLADQVVNIVKARNSDLYAKYMEEIIIRMGPDGIGLMTYMNFMDTVKKLLDFEDRKWIIAEMKKKI